MERRTKITIAKTATLLAAIPILIYADANGPDPGLSGVPNETGTCAVCHASGASSINTKGGSVTVTLPNGNSYAPGKVQHLVVTVADSTAKRWGFQLTARVASSTGTQAGNFTSTDSNTQVICSNTSLRTAQRTTSTCPSTAPLAYVEHTLAGTRLGTTGSVSFAFDWTPPSTEVGKITLYVAANAANGNNQDDTGDHVYRATYSLTAAASAPPPTISAVVNGATFAAGIEAGSWVTIQGTNLTAASSCDPVNSPGPGCRTWSSSDFTNGTPTQLDGVSVSIGGKPAFVYYISPTQINVQAPDVSAGDVAVTVTNANGPSRAATATASDYAPGFFQTSKYAIATHQDGTLVAPSSVIPGASPAARGETVILWGTGFGPVSPAVPPGQTSSQVLGASLAYASAPPYITIGGVTATVVGVALNPSALGLYQIAVTVPNGAQSGDQSIQANSNGNTSPTGVMFAVQ